MDKIQQDILWKRSQGVAHTSTDKEPSNEFVPSADIVLAGQVWTKSSKLPRPSPLLEDERQEWNNYLKIFYGDDAIQMRLDDSSRDSKTWVAVKDHLQNLRADNLLLNLIPPRLHPSYKVRVWAGSPTDSSLVPVRLMPFTEDYEWEFDYAAGVLYFYNDIPPVALERGIWIEAWQYVGPLGELVTTQDLVNRSREQQYTFVTENPLEPFGYVDFELETGSGVTLTFSSLDGPGTLECHTSNFRDDTNPYRFVAIAGHLVDDGSYAVAGRRVFGPRFIRLENLSDPYRGVTYWRVYNDAEQAANITVVVKGIATS